MLRTGAAGFGRFARSNMTGRGCYSTNWTRTSSSMASHLFSQTQRHFHMVNLETKVASMSNSMASTGSRSLLSLLADINAANSYLLAADAIEDECLRWKFCRWDGAE
eukprot:GHVU01188030.1.p1 GENE.GHVU01188030.1~~GHVU01188030.1.p1  ORF type:complete len:107 (+),score=11.20 GHVU01188030.1:271-591(+)